MLDLTIANVHHFLMSRGLLTEADVVNGDYVVKKYYHRSKVFTIEIGSEYGYVIKQPRSEEEPTPYLLQKDATTLWNIWNEEIFSPLKSITAAYKGFDVPHQALITGLLVSSVNLEQHRILNEGVSDALMIEIVSILIDVHIPFEKIPENPSTYFYPRSIPWIFEILSRYDDGQLMLPHYAAVSSELLRRPGLEKLINEIKSEWDLGSFIHGDIKWSNLLIADDSKKRSLVLIDWEMADFGDPMWDVAGLIQNMLKDALLYKISVAPTVSGISIDKVVIDNISQVLSQYFDQSEAYDLNDQIVKKVLKYSIMRLLQSACEINNYNSELSHSAYRVLDFASHLVRAIDDMTTSLVNSIRTDQ